MTADEALRRSFNEVAELYDEVRPGYPEALIDDVVHLSGLAADGQVLEVGCGTGQATLPFARRGYEVLALEPGESLARIARQNCRDFSNVDVHTVAFEDHPAENRTVDLLISAQAFHWFEPRFACTRAAQFLHESGSIALFWNLDRSQHTGFWKDAQELYDRYLPDPETPVRPSSLPDHVVAYRHALASSEMFGEVLERSYPWRAEYSCADYMKLLNTFSNHRALALPQRSEFFAGIEATIQKHGGTVTRFYEARLLLSRRV